MSEADINANPSGAIADRGGFGLNDLLGICHSLHKKCLMQTT